MTAATLRCAIYTRKSSEEGLEQGFNSLQAQREACQAYVLSQAGEGWRAQKTLYDDGGYSGGSMDRPGLRALLDDIDRGGIDVVVVYKVDRLTRSLADFAKIVELFDRKGVSFVSVTQAFNTTSSMGRLTLNVLLSFAQFEREVTGERIRDKVAASKAKGMWMGGNLPLGYDLPSDLKHRALVVNQAEADTVRLIFETYLELGSVHLLEAWLDRQGIRSKSWTSRSGRPIGGQRLRRGALYYLLQNEAYVGRIRHGDKTHPGLHPSIIDQDLFDRVAAALASRAIRHKTRTSNVATMPLKGLVFDAQGEAMSPVYTKGRKGQTYRYYVSHRLQRGVRRPLGDDSISRVPAGPVEGLVKGCLERLAGGVAMDLKSVLARVDVRASTLELLVRRQSLIKAAGGLEGHLEVLSRRLQPGEQIAVEEGDSRLVRVTLSCRLQTSGGQVSIAYPRGDSMTSKPRPDRALIKALKTAHGLVAGGAGEVPGSPRGAPMESAPSDPYLRRICRLAFLAPDIQALILEGRQPHGMTLKGVLEGDLPGSWQDQRRHFGIPC